MRFSIKYKYSCGPPKLSIKQQSKFWMVLRADSLDSIILPFASRALGNNNALLAATLPDFLCSFETLGFS
jgi:hypothetical protein